MIEQDMGSLFFLADQRLIPWGQSKAGIYVTHTYFVRVYTYNK
jgi:hypothetical protein